MIILLLLQSKQVVPVFLRFLADIVSSGNEKRVFTGQICLLFGLLTVLSPVFALPLHRLPRAAIQYNNHGSDYRDLRPDSTTYLSKFGYLPKSDMETGALRNKSEFTKALKKFQTMAHIPVTGELDEQTINKMSDPRCGVADDTRNYADSQGVIRHKRYVLGPSKWPHKDLTYRILNYSPDLSVSEIRRALYDAFLVWSSVTQLTFNEASSGEVDMNIKFVRMFHYDGYSFDGQGMTLAHAFFPGEDSGGDVHFDDDETWTVHSNEGVNLFIVAAHEMGHALGLGHSSVLGSLMYPWYQGYTPNFQLHSDDLDAIQYLYGYNTQRPTPTPGTSRPSAQYTTTQPLPTAFTTRRPISTTAIIGNQTPNPCRTDIDAAALIRQEVYMFKGLWFWRIDENGVMEGYPVEVKRFWYNFPTHIDHFDAVYERVGDGKIVFFSGKKYWLYNGNHMDRGFPTAGLPLTDLGFPEDISKIDAAFVWGYNYKTYLVTGRMYWKYNEELHRMDPDYPRDMSMWAGVQTPVDAAFKAWDGMTYFVKGSLFWRFKDSKMQVEAAEGQPIGSYWLNCHSQIVDDLPSQAATLDVLSVLIYITCSILVHHPLAVLS